MILIKRINHLRVLFHKPLVDKLLFVLSFCIIVCLSGLDEGLVLVEIEEPIVIQQKVKQKRDL